MTLKSRSDGVVSKDAESQPSTKLPVLLDLFYLSCLLTLLFAYWWHSEVSARLDRAIEDNELNITGRADQGCLIFNRVPKVGSQTINNLIAALRERNSFVGFTSIEGMPESFHGETTFVPEAGFRNMTMKAIHKQEKPFAFLKHQNFMDFDEVGLPFPIYINFVRHPVERIISWYYYVRAPWYQIEEDKYNNTVLKTGHITLKELKLSMEDCYSQGLKGCVLREMLSIHKNPMVPDHASQMTFFCGHSTECDMFNGEALFQKAVENVEKHFAVVGVLEEMDMSLRVLETYIPKFFAGALDTFYNESSPISGTGATGQQEMVVNKNTFKPKVSQDLRDRIGRAMSREIQFYHFCKQRLRKQFLAIQ